MGGESTRLAHTHTRTFIMKLVYTLASLATALVTGAELDLSTKNVRQLQHSIQNKIADKYNAKLEQSRQKRGLFNDYLSNEIDLNAYQDAAADCSGLTSDFWKDCRQCVAQQCTTYMSENCGSNSPVPAAMSSSEFVEFLAQQMGPVSPSITEIDDYAKIMSKNGVNAEIDYQMNGVKLLLNTADLGKKKMAKRDTDVALDCMKIVSEVNNIKVECARSNEGPVPAELQAQPMEHTIDPTQFGNWMLSVKGTHATDMSEQGITSDGMIQIRLTVLPNSDEDDFGDYFGDNNFAARAPLDLTQISEYEYAPHTANEISYPAHEGEGHACEGPACMNLGGNDYIMNVENEYEKTNIQYNCDGNGGPNCDQTIINLAHDMGAITNNKIIKGDKPCENEDSEEIPADYEELLQLEADNSVFCESLGGCPDVPIVRRNSRGNRVVRAAKAARCADVETMPATCLAYGFNCDACDQDIKQLCPAYHAIRSELSAKIAEASSMAEEFMTISRRDSEQIKFLHALNVAGSKAIYVQSATLNKKTDSVSLAIRVGNAGQAATVLVDAKLKSADDWSEVNSKIADKVVELF